MRKQTAMQVGVSMIGAVITIGGICLDTLGFIAPFKIDWRWIELIGFVIFAFFVYMGWYSATHKLRQHENTHPIANVTPIKEGKFVYLEIKNIGHNEAKFIVQALKWEGIKSNQPRVPYNIKWENNLFNNAYYELIPDQINRVCLINDKSLLSTESEATKYYKIALPSNGTSYECEIESGKKLNLTIQIIASPKTESNYKRTYSLMINNDNEWLIEAIQNE